MKRQINLVTALFLIMLICGINLNGCNEDSGMSKEDAASSMTNGKSDSGEDICEVEGWYDDGVCDVFCPTADPDCEQEEICKPECRAIGSKSEGWYDNCTDKLIGWANCEGCNAICQAVGSRSEGWYDSCESGINGTGLIRWEKCGETNECPLTGIICDSNCGPDGQTAEGVPCQKGIFNQETCVCDPLPESCRPECRAIGSKSEGWYDSCTGDLIGWNDCDGCTAECRYRGSMSQGWYVSCEEESKETGLNDFGLIKWDVTCDDVQPECPLTGVLCTVDCPDSGSLNGAPCQKGYYNQETCVCEPIEPECPLTGVVCTADCPDSGRLDSGAPCWKGNFNNETCVCEPIDDPECPLTGIVCSPDCPAETGELDGGVPCQRGTFNTETCTCETTCRPVCSAIGSRSEGWYDSCTENLIGWFQCENCEVTCDNAGTRSEGWGYNCTDGTTGFIGWADCDPSK